MSGFWNSWPSWVTEMVSGVLFSIPGMVWLWYCRRRTTLTAGESAAWIIGIGNSLGFIYERWIDPRGFAWVDFCQRTAGILLVSLAAFMIWRRKEGQ